MPLPNNVYDSQIPSAWRPAIEDPSMLQLFLDFYTSSQPPLSNMSLECMVRLASVRRSLFSSEAERSAFLSRLVTCTRDILRGHLGLAVHANYHEFCRLLGRLKTNYQLSELVSSHIGRQFLLLLRR
jgi:exportin-7